MSTRLRPFHLAFPVTDLEAARHFYTEVLGCRVGRTAAHWVDFDFFGHQLTAHLVSASSTGAAPSSAVDGDEVPVRHHGVILTQSQWDTLAARLQRLGTEFLIQPRLRFRGEPGEQSTMFLRDPSGNAIEFKAFRDDSAIFARR